MLRSRTGCCAAPARAASCHRAISRVVADDNQTRVKGLFDARFFAAMKPGGYFINVGRGGSVVTADLVAALESGQLAGAGLDVTNPEPLTAGHPLWAMDNVIITPHVAAESDLHEERTWLLVTENLRRYAAGEPLLNVVDIERGY